MQDCIYTAAESVERSGLKGLPLFKACQDSFFQKMAKRALTQKHSKGKILFLHGDEARYFYFIQKGLVRLFRETLDGSQVTVDILPAGQVLALRTIFEDDLYPYSAEIVENAEITSYPLSYLKDEIQTNNTLALNMLSSMSRCKRRKEQEIEHREIQNAPQRIGCFLLRLIPQNKEGPVTIHLPYDKTLVAARLGMQPETFSRALSKLKRETGIKIKGATIELDTVQQLVQFSCAACSSEFPCKDLQQREF